MNLLELDALAHDLIRERGAESCYIDYHPSFGAMPFGKVLCTSVNDAVLHGLPFDYVLRDGDLLSLDFAASVDGWVSDSALSLVVGTPDQQRPRPHRHHAARPRRGRSAAAQPGSRLGDISAAIAEVARGRRAVDQHRRSADTASAGRCTATRTSPTTDAPGRGYPLRPGLVIAIEPWFLQTTDQIYTDRDGWTLRSADGSRGAHSEHTIAITELHRARPASARCTRGPHAELDRRGCP